MCLLGGLDLADLMLSSEAPYCMGASLCACVCVSDFVFFFGELSLLSSPGDV